MGTWLFLIAIFGVIILIRHVVKQSQTDNAASRPTLPASHNTAEDLIFISELFSECGYILTAHGSTIAHSLFESGYSKEETFSYLALVTLAQHMKSEGNDVIGFTQASLRGIELAKIIKKFNEMGYIRTELYNNDITAISALLNMDSNQIEWIEIVLTSDPTANADRIAYPLISST